MTSQPQVSVGIPTYRRPDFLHTALTTLLPHVDRIREILIASNDVDGSTNHYTAWFQRSLELSGVPVTILPQTRHLVDSYEHIATRAASEVLLILDDDAILSRNYFDLADYFYLGRTGAVSGTVFTPYDPGFPEWSDERVHNPKDKVWANQVTIDERDNVQWVNKKQVYLYGSGQSVFSCEYLFGSAMFYRRVAFLEVLDHNIARPMGGGEFNTEGIDVDITMSLREHGHDLILDMSAVAWHMYGMHGRKRPKDQQDRLAAWNYIFRKHGLPEHSAYGWSLPQDKEEEHAV